MENTAHKIGLCCCALQSVRKRFLLCIGENDKTGITDASSNFSNWNKHSNFQETYKSGFMERLRWKSLIEDKVIAEAILDRLVAAADVIHIKGSSFRRNHKKKRVEKGVKRT